MTSSLCHLAPGLAVLPVLLVFACDPKPEPEPEASLHDRVFLSQSVTEGGAPQALVGGTRLRLQFHEDPRVSASAGCNSLSGSYSIDGGVLVLTDAGQTEIGCDEERHAQDDWYFEFLLSSPTLVVDGDSLVLDDGSMRIEYLDQEVATPDEELVGPTWTVTTILSGGLAMVSDWPAPATFVFGSDGVVQVSTGCNSGTGTYSVSGSEITFADVAVTERGCNDQSAQQLETAVLDVVHGSQPVSWEVTVDRLSLRRGEEGLDLAAGDG